MTLGGDDGINLGRRRHPRFAVEVTAEVSAGGQKWTALSRDVSRGGICFELPAALDIGAPFDVTLSLLLGPGNVSESLTLVGEVVWCTQTADGFQIGAAFTQMTTESQDNIQLFLKFLADGVPAEGEDKSS